MRDYINNVTLSVNTTGYSEEYDLGQLAIVGLMPASGWDGTATNIVIEASPDDGDNWYPVNDAAGSLYAPTVAASQYTPCDYGKTFGVSYLRLRSANSLGTLTGQGAAVDVVIATIPAW